MPVGAVGGGGSRLVGHNSDERVTTSAVPKTDGAAREVDIISKVVPYTGGEGSAPLRDTIDAPVESACVRSNTDLELGEVRLEEHHLMLRGSWWVGGFSLDREVVIHLSSSQVSRGLGDEFCSHHGLTVPV